MKSSYKVNQQENEGMQKVFASYHFCQLENPLIQGFGNFVGAFNMEAYKGEVEKFVMALERHLKNVLQEQIKKEVQVKVLFFR